ncbi:MAG TPA: D-alanyl-D-alanine carboxypeptidase family protein [Clostridia bacterium]
MKKLLSIFVIFFIISQNLLWLHAEPLKEDPPKIDAESYILADLKSGKILYEHDADLKHYPASTTKILTAALALENAKLDQVMTASKEAVNDIGKDGMNIGILPGEELTLDTLLHALLIRSANETANIIAENVCPTRQEFVDLMNKKAQELGATNTHFVNPCGSHNKDHYTTARDMLKIARYCMSMPKFKEIVAMKDYTPPPTSKHDKWPVLGSTNIMINAKSKYFTKVTGIKTGYTEPAGNNLISSAVDDSTGMELIAVVFGVGPNAGYHAVFKMSQELLEYGFKNYAPKNIAQANSPIVNQIVKNASNDTKVDLVTQESLDAILPKDSSNINVTKEYKIDKDVTAPVKKGDVYGAVEYSVNGVSVGKVALVASNDVAAKSNPLAVVKKTSSVDILKYILGAMFIAIGFIALRLSLKRVSKRINYRKSRRL